jgi:hypothetical protein
MNDECGEMIVVGKYLYGRCKRPEKVDTCVKTMHGGTMERGFTVM